MDEILLRTPQEMASEENSAWLASKVSFAKTAASIYTLPERIVEAKNQIEKQAAYKAKMADSQEGGI